MNQQILKTALALYGTDQQILQAVEECSELQQALMHYRRGKIPHAAVVDEIADVMFMAQQMRLVFGPRLVDDAVAHKIERLGKRVAA